MSVYTRTTRIVLRVMAIISGTVIAAFAILVLVRTAVKTTPQAEAASVIYYPNFCLGGWKYPQHASGPAAVTGGFDPSKFNAQNSAFLDSSTASQIFCGYFSVRNAKNPPTKATITFNWLLAFDRVAADAPKGDSYTSTSTNPTGISPETGFVAPTSTPPVSQPVVSPQSPVQTPTQTPSQNQPSPANPPDATTTPPTSQSGSSNTAAVGDSGTGPSSSGMSSGTTTEIPVIPGSTPPDSSSANQGTMPPTNQPTPPVSDPTPAPAPAPNPGPALAPSPTPSEGAPQTFNFRDNLGSLISSLMPATVFAAETDATPQAAAAGGSFSDFLEISYSLDGIRWNSIGRVNKDNWKNYSLEIPVTSWDEVKRLQVMVSVLPTIDEKPDIYLDSISMKAEYKQTVAELAAQGFNAVSNAVDSLIGDGNGPENAYDIVADAPAPRPTTELRTKKLLFSSVGMSISIMHDTFDSEGRVVGKVSSKKVAILPSGNGSSLQVSGGCEKKYFVVLTYNKIDDYLKRPRSFIVNRADECKNGHFTFDLASLSPETRDGPQYLVVGEQGEEGTWGVVSDIFPIHINATTTVQIIN